MERSNLYIYSGILFSAVVGVTMLLMGFFGPMSQTLTEGEKDVICQSEKAIRKPFTVGEKYKLSNRQNEFVMWDGTAMHIIKIVGITENEGFVQELNPGSAWKYRGRVLLRCEGNDFAIFEAQAYESLLAELRKPQIFFTPGGPTSTPMATSTPANTPTATPINVLP